MFFDEAHEVRRSVAGQRRFGEVWIGGKEILRAGVQVGEVAAAAAGDQDFLADSIRAFEHQNIAASLAGFNGTHQAGRAGPENDDVVFPIHAGMSLTGRRASGVQAFTPTEWKLKTWWSSSGSNRRPHRCERWRLPNYLLSLLALSRSARSETFQFRFAGKLPPKVFPAASRAPRRWRPRPRRGPVCYIIASSYSGCAGPGVSSIRQLAGLPAETLADMRGTQWALALCFVAVTILSWTYFFTLPIVFLTPITLCLIAAVWLSGKPI
jgi:hypothetical protein